MQTYITKSGDTWDSIAFWLYGDEQLAKVLIEANTTYIKTIIFKGGVSLKVPEIVPEAKINNLPPWKK